MHRAVLILVSFISLLLLSVPAFPAQDGTVSNGSSATFNIFFQIPAKVQIAGLQDISFTGQGPKTKTIPICVYENSADGYFITVKGSGLNGSFTLTSGSVSLPYTVSWIASGTASGPPLPLKSTIKTGPIAGANTQDCNTLSQYNAQLMVTLDQQAYDAATSGSYVGILTITVQPN